MPSVVSLGEALIDMFAGTIGVPLKEAASFIPAPGGAPANVAVALARLGVEVGAAGRNLGTRSRACAGFARTQRPAAVSHRPLSRYLGSRSGPAPA